MNKIEQTILLTIMLCFVFPLSVVFLYGYHRLEALILRKYVVGICATLILLLAAISLIVIYRLFAPLRALKDAMEKVGTFM